MMSPSPWAYRRSLSRDTSSFSSRTNRLLGSSLITALQRICLARSAYLGTWRQKIKHVDKRGRKGPNTHTCRTPLTSMMLQLKTAAAHRVFAVWDWCKSPWKTSNMHEFVSLKILSFKGSFFISVGGWICSRTGALCSTWACSASRHSWCQLDSGQQPLQCESSHLTQITENINHVVSDSVVGTQQVILLNNKDNVLTQILSKKPS